MGGVKSTGGYPVCQPGVNKLQSNLCCCLVGLIMLVPSSSSWCMPWGALEKAASSWSIFAVQGPIRSTDTCCQEKEANFPTRHPTMTPPYQLVPLTGVAASCHLVAPISQFRMIEVCEHGFVQFKKRPRVP